MDYVQILQTGVIGLAAIMLVRASMLLMKELSKPQVRPAATRLISIFLVFCVVLAGISGVVQYLDNKSKQAIAESMDRQKIARAHDIGKEVKSELRSKELLEAAANIGASSQNTYNNIIARLKALADELSTL